MKVLYSILAIGLMASMQAQSLDRLSQSAQTGSFANNKFQLEWVIGESVASTLVSPNVILSQGFLQWDSENGSTPIYEVAQESWTVYPNPTSTSIIVNMPEFTQAESLVLYSIQGKEVLSYNILSNSNFELNVEELPSGTYILTAKSATGSIVWSSKLMKVD